jgi:hypothetical protein
MFIKQIKKKCNAKGCLCTTSYVLSKSREFGMSVTACLDCLKEAVEQIEAGDFKVRSTLGGIRLDTSPPLHKGFDTPPAVEPENPPVADETTDSILDMFDEVEPEIEPAVEPESTGGGFFGFRL